MQRVTYRSPLCVLLSGLLLSACGGIPEEALAPVEELGTQESALCYSASVTSLTIDGVSTWGGVMAGSGTYAVGGGANAVRLEYYADGALKYYEERQGTSGSWNYSYGGFACGAHNFQVKAFPMVVDSAGTRTTCSSTYAWSPVRDASENCPTPSTTLSCSRYSSTQIKCTGTASAGSGSYTPQWQEVYEYTPYGWFNGSWTEYFFCGSALSCGGARTAEKTQDGSSAQMLPPDEGGCIGSERLQIQFKVRDSLGAESVVRSSTTYTCYY